MIFPDPPHVVQVDCILNGPVCITTYISAQVLASGYFPMISHTIYGVRLTMPEPRQRLHVSGLVPGGTPLPPKHVERKAE